MTEQHTIPPGYWMNAQGDLVRAENVSDQDKLEDELVRKLMAIALDLEHRLSLFRAMALAESHAFRDLVAQEYGATKGGAKGNMTLSSFDGTMQLQIAVSDQIVLGPELNAAKTLIDQCVTRWADGANEQIHVLVNHAFQVNKEGRIDTHRVLGLTRLEIEDDEWNRAMDAIKDAIRVTSTKTYIRLYEQNPKTEQKRPVVLDVARA